MLSLDDREFDAFIARLIEIGYLIKRENCVELADIGVEPDLDELKKETVVDNSKLEELMKHDITPQMEMEFLKILKESRLFLPVDFGPDAFKDIEESKPGDVIDGPEGFPIQSLKDDRGNVAVPLFTSDEMMEKAMLKAKSLDK